MERYYTQTIGTPLFTSDGIVVGLIIEIVIDPATGKVAGFLLTPGGQHVVAPNDVIFWEKNIFIQDEEDILETHEIFKVAEILQKNIPIIGNKVFTKNGTYLGKVYDIGLNPKLFVMTKLAVAKNILGLFPHDKKLIAHANILEIKPDRIIVKNIEATVPAKEKTKEESLKIDIAPSTMRKL